ncbi:MAG: DUF445 domain-containing protein [Acidimicrobiia bacterium]|nr:DUF445 domain-containing protein [Acidimicrobiia bacterium]
MTDHQPTLPSVDERRRGLRIMRSVATGLLVLSAAIFIWTLRFAAESTWIGYLQAATEAAMVGAIADWFAVTAIFKHPLGIPIPHTALIPRGKDAIGRGLGEFIRGNFLAPAEVSTRIHEARPAERLGNWLGQPDNAASVANQIAALAKTTVDMLSDDEVQGSIEAVIAARVRSIPLAPLIGGAIENAMADDRHHVLVDGVLAGVDKAVVENQQILRDRLGDESPWWVPEPVDDAVFRRIVTGVRSFIADLKADPHHQLRKDLDARAADLALRLRESPDMQDRVDELKEELINHPEFRAWAAGLWTRLKADLIHALDQPDSAAHQRIEKTVREVAQRLTNDPDLQETVDNWLAETAKRTLADSGHEIVNLVAGTVERWDAKETASRIELLVGKDLQYIRINGTIVGALVGLVIHAVAENLI